MAMRWPRSHDVSHLGVTTGTLTPVNVVMKCLFVTVSCHVNVVPTGAGIGIKPAKKSEFDLYFSHLNLTHTHSLLTHSLLRPSDTAGSDNKITSQRKYQYPGGFLHHCSRRFPVASSTQAKFKQVRTKQKFRSRQKI